MMVGLSWSTTSVHELMDMLGKYESKQVESLTRTTHADIPTRNKSTARACVSEFGDKAARIVFLHNRKAGGTSIRRWLGEEQMQ